MLLPGSMPSSMIFDQWVTAFLDAYSLRRKRAQAISASDCSCWPTPRTITGGAESAERKKELGRENAGGGDLQAVAHNWPTPAARDHKGSLPLDRRNRTMASLDEAAGQKWQTPGTIDATSREYQRSGNNVTVMLPGQARQITEDCLSIRQVPEKSSGGRASSTSRRRLNPLFVEWLMGWPRGWSGFDCSATEWSRWLRQSRTALSTWLSAWKGAHRELDL
jgi:hypothetical protein